MKDLSNKVFSEYKLHPRKSKESNPDAAIYLVHNQGVYCMADCKHELSDRESSIVYAIGCNPLVDEGWLQTSRTAVGGDDFCHSIPPEWVEIAIVNEQEFLELKIDETGIELLSGK
ncbi:DUF3085 domain-containing protein [Vibrio vulnificus]|uniref:DUF3085 domain-containing protein n=1 Tax=Vibrio vulnificus TaxID=672 RepID=UPI0026468427|nr:DUF3085 domain-containing protein [Vibrio vulnificus]